MSPSLNVAIIGSGVIGLSTALSIQRTEQYAKICIFADKFDEDTLSAGAGGIYRPEISIDPDQKRVIKWCNDSLQHFEEILKSSDANAAGMQLVSGYQLSSAETNVVENPLLRSLLPNYRKMTSNEINLFPDHYKCGMFYTTFVTDCRYYLKWMKSRFENLGGLTVRKHISHLSEIPEHFDVIVNCAGLGAKQLVSDDMLVPVRGQTIKVKAPWIKHFYYGDEAYIVPGVDYVTLGGVKDFSSWNMNINAHQKDWIWEKCTELVPSLKNAEVMWDWVGLRPFRSSVRLDANLMNIDGKYRKVVNNYGHGGHGVTLSWGTALEAADLVSRISKQDHFFSKL